MDAVQTREIEQGMEPEQPKPARGRRGKKAAKEKKVRAPRKPSPIVKVKVNCETVLSNGVRIPVKRLAYQLEGRDDIYATRKAAQAALNAGRNGGKVDALLGRAAGQLMRALDLIPDEAPRASLSRIIKAVLDMRAGGEPTEC